MRNHIHHLQPFVNHLINCLTVRHRVVRGRLGKGNPPTLVPKWEKSFAFLPPSVAIRRSYTAQYRKYLSQNENFCYFLLDKRFK